MSSTDNAMRFAASLRDWAGRKYPAMALSISQQFARAGVYKLVFKTRVKTGKARANYQAKFFGPQADELPIVDPTGYATVSREWDAIKNAQPFQNIFLTNPLPYIPMLEGLDAMFAETQAELAAEARDLGARGFAEWKAANP